MVALDIPFVSEAYDRLKVAQMAFVRPGAVEPVNCGERIKAARTELGLTQAGLANKLGLTGTFIGMMERDDKPIEPRTDLAVRYLLVEFRA